MALAALLVTVGACVGSAGPEGGRLDDEAGPRFASTGDSLGHLIRAGFDSLDVLTADARASSEAACRYIHFGCLHQPVVYSAETADTARVEALARQLVAWEREGNQLRPDGAPPHLPCAPPPPPVPPLYREGTCVACLIDRPSPPECQRGE